MPLPSVDPTQARREPVCVVGAGPSGLITAHVLLRDGFENVQVLCRDSHVGGVWARERVYPGMKLNNVHGEFSFSALPMEPPENTKESGGRLRGIDVNRYMEQFHDKLLCPEGPDGKPRSVVRFNTEVTKIERGPEGKGWNISVREKLNDGRVKEEVLYYPKIVLCTGGNSAAKFAPGLSPEDARAAGFTGSVMHPTELWPRIQEFVDEFKSKNEGKVADKETATSQRKPVIIIGGGKSAQDVATHLAREGVPVIVVYRMLEKSLASPKPMPDFIRKGRLTSVLSPYVQLRSRTEKFFHTTWLGAKIIRFFWNRVTEDSHGVYSVPRDSPLRIHYDIYWDVRSGDDGVRRSDSFAALTMQGKINIIAPAYVSKFDADGVVLVNGEKVEAAAIIVATGYECSWKGIMTDELMMDIGLKQKIYQAELDKFTWDYKSLANPPPPAPQWLEDPIIGPGLYKGLVPARSIGRRDIAAIGTNFTANNGYTLEVCANWTSAYLMGEAMHLPESGGEAALRVHRDLAWARRRYPGFSGWTEGPSIVSVFAYFGSMQEADELLEDMYLPSLRSGGNGLTWMFKPVSIDELGTVGEERERKRDASIQA